MPQRDKTPSPEQQDVMLHTENWVKQVIMKYNICPFARREIERASIRYAVVEARQITEALLSLIEECQYLDKHPETETTLVIYPHGFEGFYPYLDLVDLATELLTEQGYEGVYQLASFHPDYCFDEEPQDSAANYTNRSPYPTIHIIREASMEQALATYDDPESIPERNIEFAQRKGKDFFEKLLLQCMTSTHKPK
ncbi:DUF1415 domain-containing protein [Shewanella gelidii]|uniref:DUF1415 domain-containing protein n=1 Tax=Shewanella gelidii TaxID=1642821 RepID=A0A917N7T6_9GAMM|nr:DUF1415 domain-containing protein [Shewanella gelidii]MCL1097387.1 DUF1415 domain-containing protein [Shewanella gelidii]GGI74805.1 DUF1415 domain-containing protein [Shewanella gelidii]